MYPPACWSPKCINSHKVAHSRSLWAGVEALPEVLLQIFRLALHSQGTYSVKSEARRPLNKLINYIITNCDACRLVTGALSENGNNLLLKWGMDLICKMRDGGGEGSGRQHVCEEYSGRGKCVNQG